MADADTLGVAKQLRFAEPLRLANDAAGMAPDEPRNFFDSSNAYGWGGSELALGKAIRGKR